MRYGKLEVSVDLLKHLLCLNGNRETKGSRLLTDIPDDTDVKTIYFNKNRNTLVLVLSGSASPLKRVSEGSIIPTISLEYEVVE